MPVIHKENGNGWLFLSAMQQIKKEQEAANLKIEFINKKKERKAQETATEQ